MTMGSLEPGDDIVVDDIVGVVGKALSEKAAEGYGLGMIQTNREDNGKKRRN